MGTGAFGEERLADGFGGLKRYKIRRKRYKCRKKGHVFETETNHYDSIYACPKCSGLVTSDCIELTLATQLDRLQEKEDNGLR